MLRFIVRRLLWVIPTLLIITFLVFCRDPRRHRPGRELPAGQPAGQPGEDPAVQGSQRPHRHDRPAVLPLAAATSSPFDWGSSIKGNRPVWPEMKDAMANTFVLGIVATVVGVTIGLGIGILAAAPAALACSTRLDDHGAFVGFRSRRSSRRSCCSCSSPITLTKWFGLDKPFLPTSGVYPPGHKGFDPVLRVKH